MAIPLTTYKKILGDTSRIIKHQKEIATLKGENFNVFSILKMETQENGTHSAFLGELLNPKGSHGLETVFLKLFLEQLDIQEEIDLKTAKVTLEKSIGSRNDEEVTGGRIDIFIEDDNGNTICIENKIYAVDQNSQIARYCNYNNEKNKVYYLTLEGDEPSKRSQVNKVMDQDFFLLSFRDDIVEWLELCQKEATQFPILRESIKQYDILIKKLTNQLSDHKMEQEIKDVIVNNYNAAKVIADNLWRVELEYTERFISEVKDELLKTLNKDFVVNVDDDLNKAWTGITIRKTTWPKDIIVKLEGVSKVPYSISIYGVKCHKEKFDRTKINEAMEAINLVENETVHWARYNDILDLSTTEKRARLFNIKERDNLVIDITDKLRELAELCEEPFTKLNPAI